MFFTLTSPPYCFLNEELTETPTKLFLPMNFTFNHLHSIAGFAQEAVF